MKPVPLTVTYQDSCHLAHGQRIRTAPRKLLEAMPGLTFREMPLRRCVLRQRRHLQRGPERDVHADSGKKMESVNRTGAEVIATANPGCILQLRAGVSLHGTGQRVVHVVELLDEAYQTGK
jgi:glycolate oxidase iron-sulfur subunit